MVTPQQLKDFLYPNDLNLGKCNRKSVIEQLRSSIVDKQFRDFLLAVEHKNERSSCENSLYVNVIIASAESEIKTSNGDVIKCYFLQLCRMMINHNKQDVLESIPIPTIDMFEHFLNNCNFLKINLEEIVKTMTHISSVDENSEFNQAASSTKI